MGSPHPSSSSAASGSQPSRSPRPPNFGPDTQPYRMNVPLRYLVLTRQKLELARLPQERRNGNIMRPEPVPRTFIESLIDHWLSEYDWRAQETYFNDVLPQYRITISGTRLHFVHRRSYAPNAVPLLIVHGWPESFIAVSNMIDELCDASGTSPPGNTMEPCFNVVVPTIPGFGFSDAVQEDRNDIAATAEMFTHLMSELGYSQYMLHSSGQSGFAICRMIALTHPENCLAIHTANVDRSFESLNPIFAPARDAVTAPPIPSPTVQTGMPQYSQPSMYPNPSSPHSPGSSRTRNTPHEHSELLPYALCDSPVGLLAYIVDAIQPMLAPRPNRPSPSNVWSSTSLVNWTMLHWIPGPENALRWLANSSAMSGMLWTTYSNVPLAISLYEDQPSAHFQIQLQSFHRIATVRRRAGFVRFPAWERPGEIVMDVRELARLIRPIYV